MHSCTERDYYYYYYYDDDDDDYAPRALLCVPAGVL
jgi:hypothetical protein